MPALRQRPWLIALLIVAAGLFLLRGPVRALTAHDERTDLRGPYIAAQAWTLGLNPYTPSVYWQLANGQGWQSSDAFDGFLSRTPYPVTALVLLAPFSRLPWAGAEATLVGCMVAAVCAAILSLGTLPMFRAAPTRRWVFVALALALSPVHTGIRVQNPAVLAIAFLVLGVAAAVRGRDTVGGGMLACAICIKPPIALPVLGYYLLRARWRVVAVALGLTALVAGIGILRLEMAGATWFADYIHNNTILLADHGGAIIRDNTAQLQFVNLQFLGFAIFDDTWRASLLAMTVSGGLGVAWLARVFIARRAPRELLEIAALAVISLLPIYHRIYDAALLLMALAWLVASSGRRPAAWQIAGLALFVPFFLPGSTLLELAVNTGRLPAALIDAWWWRTIVMPHQVWALTLLGIVLLVAHERAPIATTDPTG